MALVPKHQDAYGAEILAYYHDTSVGSGGAGGAGGRPATQPGRNGPGAAPFEIVERDDGYIGFSRGPERYFSPYDQWPQYERDALSFARGRVVDVGCGAGRHSIHLKSQGHAVVPLDNSPGAVEVSRLRGLDEARLAGIQDITAEIGSIDTMLFMGNNFGLFQDRETCRELLGRFHGLTGAAGRIIAESMDPYATKDPDHLQYHRRNRAAGRMGGQLRIRIRFRRIIGPWFDYLLVSRDEMRDLLAGTGWHLERVIEGPGGAFVAIIGKAG
ncbi:MAG: class I SAM-dependent methyltransferase [bacterium]